jgi:hypothetical protein
MNIACKHSVSVRTSSKHSREKSVNFHLPQDLLTSESLLFHPVKFFKSLTVLLCFRCYKKNSGSHFVCYMRTCIDVVSVSVSIYLFFHLVIHVTLDTSITIYSLYAYVRTYICAYVHSCTSNIMFHDLLILKQVMSHESIPSALNQAHVFHVHQHDLCSSDRTLVTGRFTPIMS